MSNHQWEWKSWFAWYPVHLESGGWLWLVTVEYKHVLHYVPTQLGLYASASSIYRVAPMTDPNPKPEYQMVPKVLTEEMEAVAEPAEAKDHRDPSLSAALAAARREGMEEAANWCGRQASAIVKLGGDEMKRQAFVEAHNAIRTLAAKAGDTVKEDEHRHTGPQATTPCAAGDGGTMEWKTTAASRARLRELSQPGADDYDRVVVDMLDDFERLLRAQTVFPSGMLTAEGNAGRSAVRNVSRLPDAAAQSSVQPDAGKDGEAWEYFRDESYFGMWCVRPRGERRFGQGFHLSAEEEAAALAKLLSSSSPALKLPSEVIEALWGRMMPNVYTPAMRIAYDELNARMGMTAFVNLDKVYPALLAAAPKSPGPSEEGDVLKKLDDLHAEAGYGRFHVETASYVKAAVWEIVRLRTRNALLEARRAVATTPEAVVSVFKDFRNRRLKWMVGAKTTAEDDLPEHLSREAEARAVLALINPRPSDVDV